MSSGNGVLASREDDGVEVLLIQHPPVNALSTGVLADLAHHVARLSTAPEVRAVIVGGDGAYFSAGADVKEMAAIDATDAPKVAERGQELFRQLSDLPVPVVASINGLAVGGGLELALACDLRVAGESAKMGAPEVGLGLIPAYGGTQRLPRAVGPAKAKELIFTGSLISATEALRIGLVQKVVPSGQELRAARDLAHTIGQKAPKAIRAAKRALRDAGERPLQDGLALETDLLVRELLPSEDLAEGIRSFVEHRPPRFRGA